MLNEMLFQFAFYKMLSNVPDNQTNYSNFTLSLSLTLKWNKAEPAECFLKY